MPRARNIKPGFFKNEELVELPFAARLLFIGLWTLADREGRLEDKPKRIKMEVFPADDVDIEACLSGLQEKKFITRYTNEEGNFLEITAFKKHQNPHYSEKASVIKPPNSGSTPSENVLIPDSLNPDSLNPEKNKARDRAISRPENVNERVWMDFLRVRAAKKAPLTETALKGIRREAEKAGIDLQAALEMSCERSWVGFKADWVNDKKGNFQIPQELSGTAKAIAALENMK